MCDCVVAVRMPSVILLISSSVDIQRQGYSGFGFEDFEIFDASDVKLRTTENIHCVEISFQLIFVK
jgi:hypothetical protein